MNIIITKLTRKNTFLYSHRKVYFTIGDKEYLRKEYQYKLVDKERKTSFYIKKRTYRSDQLTGNVKYTYKRLNKYKIRYIIDELDQAIKEYQFKLRGEKIKRLIKEV